MTAARATRGRPKGSGIDDQQRIAEIGRVLGANPRMKPTTAIKALGVTDPSAIRRLRDKFNMAQTASPAPKPQRPAVSGPAPVRAAALQASQPVKRADPKPSMDAGAGLASAAPTAKSTRTDNFPVAAALFGFGLNAATALFEQQMVIAQSVMTLPPVRDFLRHQMAFTEFMLNVASPSPGSRFAH
jgi:hypothetical protein